MLTDFRPLLKNSNFRFLWTSQVLSQLTIHIMNFLFLIRLFTATNSTIATSFLWVAYALPAILIGPFAAASVDMVDRRKILVVTNLAQSATIFFYAISHQTNLFLLYGVVLTYSFLNQFYVPAELASLPGLVNKKILAHANGLFFLTQTAALIVGFGVAGILNQLLGFTKTLYLCSTFLFFAFISVSFLPEKKMADSIPKKFEEAFVNFFERIVEGYRFIRGKKSILAPFILLMSLQIAVAVVVVNVPVLATDILKIAVESAGVAIAVPVGVGAALGALIVPKLLKSEWRKKRAIEASLMTLALAIFGLAFVVPELGTLKGLILGVIIIMAAGAAFVGVFIPAQTYLQEATPGGLRGRVFGNYWFLVTITTVFPVILSGTITDLFGVRFLFFLLGVATLTGLYISKKFGQVFINAGFSFEKKD